MLPIVENCTSQSVVKGSVSKVVLTTYLELTLYNDDLDKYSTVDIFVGKVYKVTYYDSDFQVVATVTGEVYAANKNSIYLHTIHANDPYSCLCESRDYLNKLVTDEKITIPISNIYGIERIPDGCHPIPPIPKERGITIVSVLGISAEFIQSLVVRVRVYDDTRNPTYEAIPVEMRTGSIYKVAYMSRKDRTTYEITGKLVKIQIMLSRDGNNKLNGYLREEAPVEEVVGEGNTIYNADHFLSLPKNTVDGERVRFQFDTSENFVGSFDYVWLKDIRSVDLIADPDKGHVESGVNTCPYVKTCPTINPPIPPVPPPPPPQDPGHIEYDHETQYDDVQDIPGELPPVDATAVLTCPLTNLPITSNTKCGDCDQVDSCMAFEEYTRLGINS